jgi:hypothetical protein
VFAKKNDFVGRSRDRALDKAAMLCCSSELPRIRRICEGRGFMRVHFVIHESFEGPGAFEIWAGSRGYSMGYSRVYAGDRLPVSAEHFETLRRNDYNEMIEKLFVFLDKLVLEYQKQRPGQGGAAAWDCGKNSVQHVTQEQT